MIDALDVLMRRQRRGEDIIDRFFFFFPEVAQWHQIIRTQEECVSIVPAVSKGKREEESLSVFTFPT